MYRVTIQRRKDRWCVALYHEGHKIWSAVNENLGTIFDELKHTIKEFGRLTS